MDWKDWIFSILMLLAISAIGEIPKRMHELRQRN